jgi:hypothetical protein
VVKRIFGDQLRLAFKRALALTIRFRMTAVRASLAGLPCAGELLVLDLHARIETGRDEGGHEDLADTPLDRRG